MNGNQFKPGDVIGDLDALFAQLDVPNEALDVAHGYADLMARVASPAFRRSCGMISH